MKQQIMRMWIKFSILIADTNYCLQFESEIVKIIIINVTKQFIFYIILLLDFLNY